MAFGDRRKPLKRGPGPKRSSKRLPARSSKGTDRARAQARVRAAVFERDGYECQVWVFVERAQVHPASLGSCFGQPTPHHLRKSGQGGGDTVENEVTLCAFHNDWVEDHPTDAYALGLVVRSGDAS